MTALIWKWITLMAILPTTHQRTFAGQIEIPSARTESPKGCPTPLGTSVSRNGNAERLLAASASTTGTTRPSKRPMRQVLPASALEDDRNTFPSLRSVSLLASLATPQFQTTTFSVMRLLPSLPTQGSLGCLYFRIAVGARLNLPI